jgi:hypothetical protein
MADARSQDSETHATAPKVGRRGANACDIIDIKSDLFFERPVTDHELAAIEHLLGPDLERFLSNLFLS